MHIGDAHVEGWRMGVNQCLWIDELLTRMGTLVERKRDIIRGYGLT